MGMVRLGLVGLIVAIGVGCGDDDRMTPDRDSGPGLDAGGTRDSGPGTTDAGRVDGGPLDGGMVTPDGGPPLVCSEPTSGDCDLPVPRGTFGPLTVACLPRCSAATAAAYRACDNQTCRDAALDADSTSSKTYTISGVNVSPGLDCASCVSYAEFHCFSLVCVDEVDTYVDECLFGTDSFACDSAIFAVDSCLGGLTPAQNDTVGACMISADGPAGCFACE